MVIKKNVIANLLSQGWTAIMALAFIPLYIELLGIEAYGLIGFFAALQLWFSILDMGMTPTINREVARFTAGGRSAKSTRDLIHSLGLIVSVVGAIIIVTTYVSSKFVATSWLKVTSIDLSLVQQAIILMGPIIAFRFYESLQRSVLIGLQSQVWLSIFVALVATMRGLGAAFILMYFSQNIVVYFMWQLIVSVLGAAILAIKVNQSIPNIGKCKSTFSIKAIAEVWHFAKSMMLLSILSLMLTQVDKLILSKILSLEQFAYYALAATIATSLFQLVGPITQAFYPKLTQLVTSEQKVSLINTYHNGAKLVTLVLFPVAAILMFFGETVLLIWTGNAMLTKQTYGILVLLVLGNFLNGLMQMPYLIQLAHGKLRLAIKTNLIAVCFLVPAIILATYNFGSLGAAFSWVVLNIGYCFIAIYFIHKQFLVGERKQWYLADVLRPVLTLIVPSILIFLLMPYGQSTLKDMLYLIITAMILGSIALAQIKKIKITD